MPNHDTADATKRIPKSLDTETKLIGNYTLTDLIVAVAPGAIVILATRTLLPALQIGGDSLQALTLPLAGLAIAVGALFVSLTPAYVSSLTWLNALASFYQTAPDVDHSAAADYTQVDRVFPDYDAIERTDGTLVGAVHVTPASMALATDQEWHQTARAFTDLLNTTVEFPIQLYSTTQSFPVDDYLADYEARLTDEDVQTNPTLERLIEEYVAWYRDDLAHRETTIRDHYVIVPVRPEAVRHTDASVTQRLAEVPYLGIIVDAVTASPIVEERAAMAAELDERLRSIERGIRELDGCDATRVSAAELTELVADYWAASDSDDRETTAALRTTPLVGGPDR